MNEPDEKHEAEPLQPEDAAEDSTADGTDAEDGADTAKDEDGAEDSPEDEDANEGNAAEESEDGKDAESATEGEGNEHAGADEGAAVDDEMDLSRSKLAEQPAAENAEPEAEPAAPVDLVAVGRTIEALLFASETALTPREMARAAGVRTADVRKAIVNLRVQLEEQHRPYELAEIANGYQLVTRPEHHPAIQKLKAQRVQRKLTQAGLETLALIAYNKEPIARSEIESVRGVDAGPVLRLLLDRKLIKIAGRGTGLGQPLLYSVSNEFLEHFGLKSAADLPKPGEFKSA